MSAIESTRNNEAPITTTITPVDMNNGLCNISDVWVIQTSTENTLHVSHDLRINVAFLGPTVCHVGLKTGNFMSWWHFAQ